MNGIDKNAELMKEEILSIVGLHTHKIRNIYLYGSRVHGTHTVNSDYDITVTATSLYLNHEMYQDEYNIHITTPDSFEDRLRKHDIHCLECIYAPDEARIKIHTNYRDSFELDKMALKKMILTQSTASWEKGRRRIEQGNIYGGVKSLFHSLRILNFGKQMLQDGCITNFGLCNSLWDKLEAFEAVEWMEYNQRWKQVRTQFMKEFKRADRGEGELVIADAFESVEINLK